MSDQSRLQTVGRFAFANSGLTRFELPKNLSSIDGSAFYGVISLRALTVQKGNTAFSSENGVLFNKTQSTLVAYPAALKADYTVPSGVFTIGDYAFAYARTARVGLNRVQKVGDYAFAYAALESLTVPAGLKTLGTSAFSCNFNLRSVVLGPDLSALPDYVFQCCSSLQSITIPAGIQSVGAGAFSGDFGLTDCTFESGSNLTQIGSGAFSSTGLTKIEIPASVVVIGSAAFAYDYDLKTVTFEPRSTLQVIGSSAFEKDRSLQSITLPDQLRQLGDYAFKESGLETVRLPTSLEGSAPERLPPVDG